MPVNVAGTSGALAVLSQLRRLWSHLSAYRRLQFMGLLALMLASAFAEIMSLSAVLPFLGALADPNGAPTQAFLARLEAWTGYRSAEPLGFLTTMFVTAALVAAAMRLLLLKATTKLTFSAGHDLSMDIYERTLFQPYSVHVSRNSAEIVSAITNKTNTVMFDILLPSLIIVNSALVLIFVFSTMLVIDPVVALGSAGFFALSYLVLARIAYSKLAADSTVIAREQTQTVRALQEGLGGIRDVLINGTQRLFCKQYRDADLALRQAQGRNLFTGGFPRYVMEALGTITIAGLAYFLYAQGGLISALPTLGLLTLGIQRLLPAFQQGYNSWSLIMGHQASLADALDLLDQKIPQRNETLLPILLQKEIRLEGVKFRYREDGPWILNIDYLCFPKGARIGIIGSTGSGKSTLLDLVMGLLHPSEGYLYIDEARLDHINVHAWQHGIAHVSQNLYLADSTIAENIAYGVDAAEVDMERVVRAAEMSHIADFIYELPDGFNTVVGERGIRLSGGQRQRIGIARALYKDASVLVLDEATSALDHETEVAVMESIESLRRDITLLIIAHRTSTLRDCDSVVTLKDGKIDSIIRDRVAIASLDAFKP